MQRLVVICLALLALVGADECPDGGRCEDSQTCCNDPANGYECCPFDQAECCEDHMHCCPAKTICDAATSSCVNATVSIPWVERVSADQPGLSKSFRMIKTYMGEEDDNICPDQSRCPPEFSCLRALTSFGCCPLAQGVSCSDGKHCCPEGHQCSANSRSCIRKELVTTVQCDDGVSECPDETTCCENPLGSWGCCPMPKAVCCEDMIHCCPEESTCDVEKSKCVSLSTKKELPMWAKLPARIRAEWENQKEGGEATAETVEGTTKDTVPLSEKDTGVISTEHMWMARKETEEEEAMSYELEENEEVEGWIQCDAQTSCPQSFTCCFITLLQMWNCCPLQHALCCADGFHCCPNGYQCSEDTCVKGEDVIPWYTKLPATTSIQAKPSNVVCDDQTQCPEGNTCCKLITGQWGCCPLPQALCCADGIHCCPNGYQCSGDTCIKGEDVIPLYTKLPATTSIQAKPSNVVCDDQTQCPDGNTCCKLITGQWGCCPLPQALCCTDWIHCCPNGYQCSGDTCIKGEVVIPWYTKLPATTSIQAKPSNVVCDDQTQCPDGNTCCKLIFGQWGCCPLPQALCCTDGIHCCPNGYQCSEDTCIKGEVVIPWYTKLPATTSIQAKPSNVVCDDQTQCPDGNTCCKLIFGQWGCCPLPQALCCTDGIHCCPNGYQCSGDTCIKGEVVIPWYTKLPATTSIQAKPSNVVCDDQTQCPDGNTCCKLIFGQWGCCPLPQALCCTDGIHCCPNGYQCSGDTCIKGEVVIPWYTKLPATTSIQAKPSNVVCDSESQCPDGNTCCKLITGQWSCCPLPQAVCCSDMKYCCPTSYTCSEGGECIKNPSLKWWRWQMFVSNKKTAVIL